MNCKWVSKAFQYFWYLFLWPLFHKLLVSCIWTDPTVEKLRRVQYINVDVNSAICRHMLIADNVNSAICFGSQILNQSSLIFLDKRRTVFIPMHT